MNPSQNLLSYLESNDLQGVFIKGTSSIRYLTGFNGDDSLLYIDDKQQVIITDSRYTLQAREQAPQCCVVEHKAGLWQEAAKLAVGSKLGLDGDCFSYAEGLALTQRFPQVQWKSLNLALLRRYKSAAELECIKRAVAISDQAFQELLPHIRVGRSEAELAAELEYNMRRLGSEHTAFTTIVASGVRSALPHGTATAKLVEQGDFLTFDFGAVYQGYCSDITRTVVLGEATAWQKEIYDIVLQANLLGEELVRPGVTGASIDAQVRAYITERGYGPNFGHGLGHGVGLDIHELPVVNKRGTDALQAGAVVTIEPGIYVAGKGGVRIEDTVVVTEDGVEILTSVPKQLLEIKD